MAEPAERGKAGSETGAQNRDEGEIKRASMQERICSNKDTEIQTG